MILGNEMEEYTSNIQRSYIIHLCVGLFINVKACNLQAQSLVLLLGYAHYSEGQITSKHGMTYYRPVAGYKQLKAKTNEYEYDNLFHTTD